MWVCWGSSASACPAAAFVELLQVSGCKHRVTSGPLKTVGEAGIVILPFEIKKQNQHSENASDSAKEWQKRVDGPPGPSQKHCSFCLLLLELLERVTCLAGVKPQCCTQRSGRRAMGLFPCPHGAPSPGVSLGLWLREG